MSIRDKLFNRIIAISETRDPDFIIGGKEDPYVLRWWVIPRNRVFNIYLHLFLRSDDDRAHHDHPWLFNISVMLRNRYVEHTIDRGGILRRTVRNVGAIKFRWGSAPHRVELAPERPDFIAPGMLQQQPCWTLFITGPVVREWGFHCPDAGWVHWKRFTAADDKGAIGAGCEQ